MTVAVAVVIPHRRTIAEETGTTFLPGTIHLTVVLMPTRAVPAALSLTAAAIGTVTHHAVVTGTATRHAAVTATSDPHTAPIPETDEADPSLDLHHVPLTAPAQIAIDAIIPQTGTARVVSDSHLTGERERSF